MSATPTPPIAHSDYWKKCSTCKKTIAYKQLYWVCNVSTCNRKRLGLQFCTVACWDAHVPGMNHRESWAEERRAPTLQEYEAELIAESEPKTRTRKPTPDVPAPETKPVSNAPKSILRKKTE